MDKEIRLLLGRMMLVVLVVIFLITSIIYLNQRWEKIRDIRRQADAQSIVKALDFYNLQFGQYPQVEDDDGDGWDKSNDQSDLSFLSALSKQGLLSELLFDPKNDNTYYYRYQKFSAGDFGCDGNYAVFQITAFETDSLNHGNGQCPDMDFASLAPGGYTWLGEE